jgi:hypothetical protein
MITGAPGDDTERLLNRDTHTEKLKSQDLRTDTHDSDDTERLLIGDTNTEKLKSQDLRTDTHESQYSNATCTASTGTDQDLRVCQEWTQKGGSDTVNSIKEMEHPTGFMVQNIHDKPQHRDTEILDNWDEATVKRDNTFRVPSEITFDTAPEEVSLLSQYSFGEDLMWKGLLIIHDEPVVKVPINPVLEHQDICTSERKKTSSVLPGGKTPVPHEHIFPVSTDQIPMNTNVLGSPWEALTALMYSTTPTLQDVKKLQRYRAYKPIEVI